MRQVSKVLAAVVAITACAATETPQQMQARMEQETAAARPALAAMITGWQAHAAAGHGDSLAAYFAENGRTMPPNAPAAVGRAAIAAAMAAEYAIYQEKVTITSDNFMANGPVALDRGTYTITLTPKPGAPRGTPTVNDQGKYLNHLHRSSDRWEIVDLIWNSDNPAMPAPAPARPATRRG